MTAGWWRRNALSLALVAVLLPVTAGVVAVNEWSEWDLGHATKPITVEPGGSAPYAGAAIGPARARFANDPAAPPGTRLVSATVLVSPGEEPISCLSPKLREESGAGRQWNEASAGLDREYDPDRLTFCDSDLPIRYSLTLDYLVPEDAAGPFVIELESAAGIPQFVRLIVEP
ncbi:hypothetical protein [Microbacterium terregens]|uniref:Uncharacterized protein n=1 Tax=Microbacterium terregens TaxID=69363 RepID=A0ABV5SV64_9MICO